MENQEKIIILHKSDVNRIIAYLKDYSQLVGKSYKQATVIEIKQQLAYLNLNLEYYIKKLEREL